MYIFEQKDLIFLEFAVRANSHFLYLFTLNKSKYSFPTNLKYNFLFYFINTVIIMFENTNEFLKIILKI